MNSFQALLLAALLFINALVLDVNEVVATSGFLGNVGAPKILYVWAADMAIVALAAGAYSLIIDRARRGPLAVRLFLAFSLVYIALYGLFAAGAPGWLSYGLLTIVNDQQWLLFPVLIWALANDAFAAGAAKRLFPRLAIAALLGGLAGNGLAVAAARALGQRSFGMLLANAGLLAAMAGVLATGLRRAPITARTARAGAGILDTLREGLAFVREVPAYRYLSLAMLLLGFAFNALEFLLVTRAAQTFPQLAALQTFYGLYKGACVLLLFIAQAWVTPWLLTRLNFKAIFGVMPASLLVGLLLGLALPGLAAGAIGHGLARVALVGVDEPSRRAFQGLVPDERRGRVSMFMDGYLYPGGIILSCGIITALRAIAPAGAVETIYLGLSVGCVAAAGWAIARFRGSYDASMLNWRLRRRQHKEAGILSKLDL